MNFTKYTKYEGLNPLKNLFKYLGGKQWDNQDAKDIEYHFTNKKRTEIKDISFFNYLIMSIFYNVEE